LLIVCVLCYRIAQRVATVGWKYNSQPAMDVLGSPT